MGRLRSLGPRLPALPPRLARTSDDEGHDRRAEPWRRWYSLKAWRQLRWSILIRDRFTCQWPGCGKLEADASKLVADHREPHRGDEALFWDASNLWCLCEHHHASAKQAEERRFVAA